MENTEIIEEIEQMAKDLKTCLPNNWYWQKTVDTDTYLVAKHFHNEGYRKIPKGSIVLNKEYLKKELQGLEQQARKQTAEKILNEQYQECKVAEKEVLIARGGNKNDDYYKGFALGMANTKMHIQELAKQFGVEVEE